MSSRHLDDGTQAVWRHVMFFFFVFTLECMATISVAKGGSLSVLVTSGYAHSKMLPEPRPPPSIKQ